jgi:hypothetical protein
MNLIQNDYDVLVDIFLLATEALKTNHGYGSCKEYRI